MQSLKILFKQFLKTRYPVVRQYDQIDCGPAALLSVLRYWGGDSSLVHVREITNTDSQGTTMLGLVEAARKLGFDAIGARGEYADLKREGMPCVAHVIVDGRLQHFVVIYEINDDKILLGDPARGLRYLNKNEFLQIWEKRAVVLLTPNQPLYRQTPPSWVTWVWEHLHKEESWLLQSLFLGVLYAVTGLLVAVFIQWLIDRFIPEGDLFKILLTGGMLMILQFIRAFAGYLRQRFLVELNQRVTTRVNRDFLRHIFNLPLRFFDMRKRGDITARVHDGTKIQQALFIILSVTIIDGLIICCSLLFIFMLARAFGWVVLGTLPVYAALLFHAARHFKQKQTEVMRSYAQVEAFYFDSLSGLNEIHSYHAAAAFSNLNTHLFKNYQLNISALGRSQARIALISELAAGALILGVLSFGALLVIQKNLLLGQMVAVYSVLANMLPAVNRMVDANILLQGASVAVQRLMDILLVDKEKDSGQLPFRMEKALIMMDVSFAWPKGQPLFHNLNLQIPRGRLSALWGISGSGKSTLVKIIQRKYALSGGRIFLDRTPIEHFELQSYRQHMGVVPQAVKVFNGTLLENILLGRPDESMNRVLPTLEELGLAAYLNRFEHGLFTLIGEEGRQLSAGESQILGLWRALLCKPDILILDEGLNGIDADFRHPIHNFLKQYAENHVVLMITHELQTIMKADVVYLLENGVIAEAGVPVELLRTNKRFQKFCSMQLPLVETNPRNMAYAS